MLEDLRKIVEIVAYLTAAGFFLFKWTSGYMSTNLSIEIACSRKRAGTDTDTDILAVSITLAKGESGSLHIFDVGVAVDGETRNLRYQLEPYTIRQPSTSSNGPTHDAGRDRERRRYVDWSSRDEHYYPFLQPGEKVQMAFDCEVESTGVSRVDVVVVGRRKHSYRIKQWRSSAVSLPV